MASPSLLFNLRDEAKYLPQATSLVVYSKLWDKQRKSKITGIKVLDTEGKEIMSAAPRLTFCCGEILDKAGIFGHVYIDFEQDKILIYYDNFILFNEHELHL